MFYKFPPLLLLALAPAAYADLPAEILADNPVGYWRLDETSGTVAADSSGNGNDLTFTNFAGAGTIGAMGAVGNATQFGRDGADPGLNNPPVHPYAVSGDPNQLGFASGTSFSIEYLFRAEAGNDSSGNAGIVTKGYDEAQELPWYISRYNGGTANFIMRDSSSNTSSIGGTTGITDGLWHHVVATYDAGGGTINLYIDGVLNASAGGVAADAFGTNARPFALANHFNRALDAGLDEVAIYGTALSASRVSDHFVASGLVTSHADPAGDKVLAIDFGASDNAGGGPGGTQSGFSAFEAAGTGSATNTYASLVGGGDIDVTVSGQTHWRDYAAHAATYGKDELLSDMVLRNADGTLTLTLDGLEAGDYVLRAYTNSSQFGGGTFDIDIDGASAETGVSVGRNGELSFTDLTFSSDGAVPTAIDLLGGANSEHLAVNGFELFLIPEPGTAGLMLFGALAFVARRRRA